MSVPYEPAPEPAGPSETPQGLLACLLDRALNSFELSDELLRRLDTAVAHDSSLHSAHHSAGLYRATHRHTWLLPDGSTCTLWELVHNTAPPAPGEPQGQQHHRGRTGPYDRQDPDDRPDQHRHHRRNRPDQHELYADEAHLQAAVARLPLPPDDPVDFELPLPEPTAPAGLDGLPLPHLPLPRHVYIPDNSADHARRLLRRAENQDRPGTATLRLLGAALAHQITQAFARPEAGMEARLGFALYEHAFLLADGREVSLWEVEHTATPDGRHMCEVYPSETAARRAMRERASQAG